MFSFSRKSIFLAVVAFSAVILGVVVFVTSDKDVSVITKIDDLNNLNYFKQVIGKSVEGRDIESYTYGSGGKHLVFVGGMHGGYEWNSVLLAYQFIDYLNENAEIIPANLKVSLIPSLNPDGLYKVVNKEGRFVARDASVDKKILASGRFNSNQVDLNRNFDCNWKSKSTWQSKTVNAGTAPFSELESKALQKFVLDSKPDAVVFWHSQSDAVYASQCNGGILPVTLDIMNVYSRASGYPAVRSFDSYEITGDAEGWLASIDIPAITVELKTHEDVEWDRNVAGVKALFDYYSMATKPLVQ